MKTSRSSRRAGSAWPIAIIVALLALAAPVAASATSGSDSESSNTAGYDSSAPGSGPSVELTGSGTGDPGAVAALDGPSYQGCPGDLARPFLAWGDEESYSLAPGGSFETDENPWYLTGGGGISAGNEPYYVHGAGDIRHLSLPASSVATSTPICITQDHPSFRFFAHSDGSTWSRLRIEVLFRDHAGNLHSPVVGVAIDTGRGVLFLSTRPGYGNDWTLSPQLPVVANNYLAPGETGEIELRLASVGSGASWSIDDVYVDPRHRN